MILDSAVRASISPRVPRLSIYIHKWHLSHELIWRTGRFVLHLLHQDQFGLVHQLGFVSGYDCDLSKLEDIPHRLGTLRAPILEDCYAAFECRVVNTMDAGASTVFLGDVVATHRGRGDAIMTAAYFRDHMPESWREEFVRNYREAQERIEKMAQVEDIRWPGPVEE